jgi:hypothetical protein
VRSEEEKREFQLFQSFEKKTAPVPALALKSKLSRKATCDAV